MPSGVIGPAASASDAAHKANSDALRREADALLDAGALDAALAACRKLATAAPDDASALTQLGYVLIELDALDEAGPHLRRAAELDLTAPDASYLLGTIHEARGEAVEAANHYGLALERSPDFDPATLALSRVLAMSGRRAEAEAVLQRGVARSPRVADFHFYLGNLHLLGERLREAAASYARAVEIEPRHASAQLALGNLHIREGRMAEAVSALRAAFSLEPGNLVAGTNLGNALIVLGRLEDAVDVLLATARFHPHASAVHLNLGNAYVSLGRAEEALARFEQALALEPASAQVLANMGSALGILKRPQEALAALERAHRIDGGVRWLAGSRVLTRLSLCQWQGIDAAFADLARRIDLGQAAAVPFAALAAPLSAGQLLRCAQAYVEASAFPPPTALPPRRANERIRLGYFSADFHGHATAYLIAELFERHDRARFELIAFSFGPQSQHPIQRRLVAAFDQFIDVRARSDAQICEMARTLGIDIAIDLKGYTHDARPAIFAQRAAPVQVSYLGFPGTMGAPFIDYLVADHVVVPPEHVASYSEKIAFLPNSYQVNDAKRQISERRFTRVELGLPEQGFVFCCFNNSFKITPEVFDVWMRLLTAVPGSVLWLLQDSAEAAANLRREAAARGVDAARLVFAPRLDLPEHLARQRLADLFLDTVHCNAHTTASDALWAGLPVLTCAGPTFASRVAASLLHALALPELVVKSLAAYEEHARALATDPGRLDALRQRLAEGIRSGPLFDAALFARHLEVAYEAMHQRSLQGLPPEHIEVR